MLRDPDAAEWLCFDTPLDILTTRDPSQVPRLLKEVECRVEREGAYAAGYLTYEAAPGFDCAYRTHAPASLPVLCFGLFPQPVRTCALPPPGRPSSFSLPQWTMRESEPDYFAKIALIKAQIEAGNTYQINYTVRETAEGVEDPWRLFLAIASDAPLAAYLDADEYAIVSASLESFFTLKVDRLDCRPMKGTAKRGMTLADDQAIESWLSHSKKNRAENVMITDMVRNDLGRVADTGSIATRELFQVERYPTLWQMTSTVTATTDAPVSEIFRALFPSASITGAPKVSSMMLIEALENSPREIYTGAIGYIAPGRRAQFSVAIRTALVDKRTGEAVYGVGSGIVWDSDPAEEYAECLAKTKILVPAQQDETFRLLETMLWNPTEGIVLLDHHIRRLRDSAEYFGFQFDQTAVETALSELTRTFASTPYRIRLLQARDGQLTLEHDQIPAQQPGHLKRIRLAAHPINAEDPFLYHKTTRRGVYEKALQSVIDCDDVLLWNRDGYITETTVANIVAEIGSKRVTPPVRCGLLGGTHRQWLLDLGEIEEMEIHLNDLATIDRLFLINSVRGQQACKLIEQARPAVGKVAN